MPALAAWHDAHAVARRAAGGAAVPAHVRLETYSVLTRFPPPHRLSPGVVGELLESWLSSNRMLVPSPGLTRAVVKRCSDRGIFGGAVYDALVGLTAAEAGATLLTRDQRAARTYERLEVAYELT